MQHDLVFARRQGEAHEGDAGAEQARGLAIDLCGPAGDERLAPDEVAAAGGHAAEQRRLGEHEGVPETAPAAAALDAARFGHDRHDGVATGGTGHGEPDFGHAAGGLADAPARCEPAAPLGVGEHAAGQEVLDRVERLEEIEFRSDRRSGRREAVQTANGDVAPGDQDAVLAVAEEALPALPEGRARSG